MNSVCVCVLCACVCVVCVLCVCACVRGFVGGIECRDICSCGKTGSNQVNDQQNWAHLNSSLLHVEMFLFAWWHSVATLYLVWHITNLNKRIGPDEFLCLFICMSVSIITGQDLRVLCVLSAYLWMSYYFLRSSFHTLFGVVTWIL
jgi:hypothetical protein